MRFIWINPHSRWIIWITNWETRIGNWTCQYLSTVVLSKLSWNYCIIFRNISGYLRYTLFSTCTGYISLHCTTATCTGWIGLRCTATTCTATTCTATTCTGRFSIRCTATTCTGRFSPHCTTWGTGSYHISWHWTTCNKHPSQKKYWNTHNNPILTAFI